MGITLINYRTTKAPKTVHTKPNPPPRGVGTKCELRLFGTSRILLSMAYRLTKKVRPKDNAERHIQNRMSSVVGRFVIILF